MNTAHSPGPWNFTDTTLTPVIIQDTCKNTLATIHGGAFWRRGNEPEISMRLRQIANARLMASAPKMLEALERIRRTSVQETFHGNVERFQEWLDSFTDDIINESTTKNARS